MAARSFHASSIKAGQAEYHAADIIAVSTLELAPTPRCDSYYLRAGIGCFTTTSSLKTFVHEIDDLQAWVKKSQKVM